MIVRSTALTCAVVLFGSGTSSPAATSPSHGAHLEVRAVHWSDSTLDFVPERSDGLRLEPGSNFFVGLDGGVALRPWLSVRYDVRLGRTQLVSRIEFREMTVAIGFGNVELNVGRATRRLGRGVRGHLLLDENARPYDLVELRSADSFALPGWFATWGRFDLRVLNGILPFADTAPLDDRFGSAGAPVARPSLLGYRISWSLGPTLEVGTTRAILYGGRGREAVDTLGEWWDLLTATDENRVDDSRRGSDQLASIDLQLTLLRDDRGGRHLRYYVEYAGTDVHASWQGDDTHSISPLVLTDVAVLQGGEYRSGRYVLQVEHVRIHRDWYQHPGYPQGYTNGGIGLGHPIGADAAGWFFQCGLSIGSDGDVRISFARDRLLRAGGMPSTRRTWDLAARIPIPLVSARAGASLLARVTRIRHDGRNVEGLHDPNGLAVQVGLRTPLGE